MSTVPEHVRRALASLHPDATFVSQDGILTAAGVKQRYLYKTASKPAAQLVGEAMSLEMLNQASREGIAPKLIAHGEQNDGQYFTLSEWHELGSLSSTSQADLGRQLAELHMHRFENESFGFPVPTFCGDTQQTNDWNESWASFFAHERIGDLLERIGDADLSQLGRQLERDVIPFLLDPLDARPSLLHGDLWSGNVALSRTTGRPLIFDPSSYFGHSEADLGITHMFGGFSQDFYNAYHEVLPKADPVQHYDARIKLYELYHHLNHTLLFGGSYRNGAKRIMELLLHTVKKL